MARPHCDTPLGNVANLPLSPAEVLFRAKKTSPNGDIYFNFKVMNI
jgi:hypothetical protein